jgi:hypothetical protein
MHAMDLAFMALNRKGNVESLSKLPLALFCSGEASVRNHW